MMNKCLNLFNGGHLAIVIMTAVGLLGTGVGVYTSLNSSIAESRKAIADLNEKLNDHIGRMDNWQTAQKIYDAEVRTRILDADKELRAGQRLIVEKLLDMKK